MNSEARKLASIQSALDAHAEACGDPVRAILLNPWEAEQLDWWEYRGLPIESDSTLPTGVVRIDCLRMTVRDAIEEFYEAMRADRSLDDAEARLRAKLDQLSARLDDWWISARDAEWWRRVADKEPDLYRRMMRGEEVSMADRVRAEAAQFDEDGWADDDAEATFHAWQDAWEDMDAEDRTYLAAEWTDLPESLLDDFAWEVTERPSLPANQKRLPANQTDETVLRPPKVKVPWWHRFLWWRKDQTKDEPLTIRKSSVRSALDRYGRSGRGRRKR